MHYNRFCILFTPVQWLPYLCVHDDKMFLYICREELDRDVICTESLLLKVNAAEQTLQQLSGERVESAMEEFSKKVC